MVAWTWERVKERLAELGFTEEEQGFLEVELRPLGREVWASYLEGSEERAKGRLEALLATAAATAAQPPAAQPASSTNLQTFLEQRLPSIVFESTALASTGKHPPPIWQFKEWVLNDDEILDEVAAAVASASSDHQLGPLYALQPRSSTNTVESEAGLRAVLDPVMCAVATALGRAGHGGCRWLLEATPPSAPAAPTAPVAAAVAAAATVEVKGPFKKPGFELFDRSRRVRSFLESKFPTLLHAAGGRSLALLGSTEQGRGQPKKGSQQDLTEVEVLEEVLEDLLGQLEEYCRLQAVRFFALSTYQYTWLCYAREGCIYMSRGIAWNSVKPTVLQALFWLCLKALTDDGRLSDAELAAAPTPTTGGGEREPRGRDRSGKDGSGSNNSGSGGSDSGSGSGLGSAPSGGPRVSVVHCPGEEEVLGTGITGPVYAGTYGEERIPVAVKWAPAGSEMSAALEHEASIYSQLQHTQGTTTPRLMFAGHSACGHWYLLLTQRLCGRPLEAGRDTHLLPAALAALRPVHAAGLCYGDVRLENFMVVGGSAGSEQERVFILDFGQCRPCAPGKEWQQLEEQEELCELLGGGEGEDEGGSPGSGSSSALTRVLPSSYSGSSTQVTCMGARPQLGPGQYPPVQPWKPRHQPHHYHHHQASPFVVGLGLPRFVGPKLPMPRLGSMFRL